MSGLIPRGPSFPNSAVPLPPGLNHGFPAGTYKIQTRGASTHPTPRTDESAIFPPSTQRLALLAPVPAPSPPAEPYCGAAGGVAAGSRERGCGSSGQPCAPAPQFSPRTWFRPPAQEAVVQACPMPSGSGSGRGRGPNGGRGGVSWPHAPVAGWRHAPPLRNPEAGGRRGAAGEAGEAGAAGRDGAARGAAGRRAGGRGPGPGPAARGDRGPGECGWPRVEFDLEARIRRLPCKGTMLRGNGGGTNTGV